MSFSFNELDSLLSDQQYAIAKRSNFDLPFGGTTEAEFDFLAKNGALNTMAPNFLSFMAGISASNLATQANRQQQFEQFGKLREANSVIANRDSATRNNLLEGDSRELQMPYVGSLAKANAGLAEENWQHQQLVNDNYLRDFNSQMNVREAQTEGEKLKNTQQRFINNNLQGREDLYTRSQNAAIDQTKVQTAGAEITNKINDFKNQTLKELHDLDIKRQNNQISLDEYNIKKNKYLEQNYEADRQLAIDKTNAEIDSEKALAWQRRNGNPKTNSRYDAVFRDFSAPATTTSPQPTPSVLNTGQGQAQDVLKIALIKQAQGILLSPGEVALLQGLGYLASGY